VSGIAAYDEKRKKAIGELKDVKSKLNTHRVILAERRRRLLALQKERDAALEYQSLTDEQERLRESVLHKKRERIVEDLKKARAEREGMDGKIAELEKEVARLDQEIENKEWELEGVQEDLAGDVQVALVKEAERIRAEILRKEGEVRFKRQQIADLEAMIDEITRMRAASQPAAPGRRGNPAVQALLERKRGGVYGTISSLASPKPGFEVAFETAAGGSLNDLVVDSRETAIDCINYLKEKRLKLPGVVDYAINLVEFDQKYRRAFEYVLSDTVVAENLEAVKGLDGVRVVTLDGDLLSKGGALSGGWRGERKGTAKAKEAGFDAARRRQQISKLKKEITRLEEEMEEARAVLEAKEEEIASFEESKDRAKGEASTKSDELRALREKRREAYQGLENLRRALTRYERREAEAQAELEALGGEEERDPSYYIEGSLAELERRLEQNRRRLARLGPVNMRAIDEYDRYEEEFNLFRERVDALEAEKRQIERLIGEIEERKRARFIEVLEAVNTRFNRIFQRLFDGGSASLELEEEGDISSGLLIKANPPDKEPHVIDSLSGGEQTLLAIAFIFALQEYQEARLLILDEIDAALDLMNITRLGRLLREYSDRIQVIVVSHNEETVRHADRAYGVTIKNGVSEVLALNLN